MTIYGYARVSTTGQDLALQESALKAAGAERVYKEKITGKHAQRPQLQAMLRKIMPGDVIVVSKLDRLARSTQDLLNTLDQLQLAGAQFRSLGDPWCDTTTPHGKLLLTILGGLAEFERHLILTRTAEGRKAAQSRGVQFGRKHKLDAFQRREARARLDAGEPTGAVAASYGVERHTIWRLTRD